jgi:outer membrane lipoprotein-sorting protein
MKQIIISNFYLILIIGTVHTQPAVNEILKKMEDNVSMSKDARVQVSMTQQKANQGTKVFDMMYYRRDKDNAFLIVLLAPEAEKGNGYLRVDDNFWMYRRNTRTFQHVNRDENIGGSDASGEDFETRKLTELYEPAVDAGGKEIIQSEKLGVITVWRFELKAKVNDVSYPYRIMWVRKDNFLQLKEQSYSNSKTLMVTSYFPKYTTVNGKYVPVKQMYIDEFEKGNKTIVELSNIVIGDLDDKIFTKAYLENLSK